MKKISRKTVRIMNCRGGLDIRHSGFPFEYESFDSRELRKLRARYRLSGVTRRGRTEFDKMVALRSWVSSRWVHGWDKINARNNSLGILAAVKNGARLNCWYYATVFVQSALSLGYHARRINIGIDTRRRRVGAKRMACNTGHTSSEIWSNQYRKWVVMDADLNAHYEMNGIPLGALEIRDAWISGAARGKLKYVQGKPVPDTAGSMKAYNPDQRQMIRTFMRHDAADYYERVGITMKNNWFADPFNNATELYWIDPERPPDATAGTVRWTSNPDDMYWDLNKTRISVQQLRTKRSEPSSIVQVFLNTFTPGFDRYMVSHNRSNWRRVDSSFRWRLGPGVNTIDVRTVNSRGVSGPASSLRLALKEG